MDTDNNVSEEVSEYVDLSFADFKVSKTGKKLDTKGPVISPKSLKVSKKVLKKNSKSKFSVKVSDKSQIKSVKCCWEMYYKGDKEGEPDHYTFYDMKYNKKKKVYECKIDVDNIYKKVKLYEIVLTDVYGNERNYYLRYNKKKYKASVYECDFYGKSKNYSLKKKDKKVFEKMVITKKK